MIVNERAHFEKADARVIATLTIGLVVLTWGLSMDDVEFLLIALAFEFLIIFGLCSALISTRRHIRRLWLAHITALDAMARHPKCLDEFRRAMHENIE